MAKRSFPHIGLGEATERIRAAYNEDHRNEMNAMVAVGHLGYSGVTGTSATMISTLKKFNLLEGRGDSLRVSDDAVTILVDDRMSVDRAKAILRSASGPDLFRDLDARFPDGGSERNVRIYLEKQGLTSKAATKATEAYSETRDFVTNETSWYSSEEDNTSTSPEEATMTAAATSATASPGTGTRDIPLPLPEGPWPVLRGVFPMNESSWQQMIALLEAMKPGLVKTDDPDDHEEP